MRIQQAYLLQKWLLLRTTSPLTSYNRFPEAVSTLSG
jgi:hypothetical protein